MGAPRVGFDAYVAANILGRLPWKRRHLRLFGPRVTTAVYVVVALRSVFLTAAALGEAKPDLVAPILKACSGPGGDLYGFGLERARELMSAAGEQAAGYYDLFPQDREALRDIDAWKKVLDRDFSFMMARLRVVEGLAFGEQHPEATRRLLDKEISEALAARDHAQAGGVHFGPIWERVEDVETDAAEIAMTWQSLQDTSVDPA